ncbi:MAG: zf-TFIIB domain-containing protein [Chlorobi bacterium]|nr:zf-TFIIB domain-containing protein [Chlorobiota bacterium]
MNCPRCKNPMVVLELAEVEIDYCDECGGIWLDQGELELLLEAGEEKDKLLNSFAAAGSVSEEKIKCPICGRKMEKVFIGEDKKVLIDKCKYNHGLWFDRGELLQTVELGVKNEADDKMIRLIKDMFGFSLKE